MIILIRIFSIAAISFLGCFSSSETKFIIVSDYPTSLDSGIVSINHYSRTFYNIKKGEERTISIPHDSIKLNTREVMIFTTFYPKNSQKVFEQMNYDDLSGMPYDQYYVSISDTGKVMIRLTPFKK